MENSGFTDSELLKKLKDWRRKTANLEGIEAFHVFANKVLENIAELKPSNKEELLAIKGIRDKKFAKYGEQILSFINHNGGAAELFDSTVSHSEKPLSVSAYLDLINNEIGKFQARIQGEISSVEIRKRVVYFSLKDSDDGSAISCLMWKRNYDLSGIAFEAGTEVILEGTPDIYKPSGRLSFKAFSAELVGEGALKKAYDQLKKKLDNEGLFLKERKREIPDLPQKIGLITSETGAVIHDFLTNLGKYGFQIKFFDSRVEGQAAVRDLVSAIDYFSDQDIDILVIIRGGGSLESLQAFNNETLVRKVAGFNKPVICGIGHEKDVPLASLAADKMVSTPTAATYVLNESWQRATNKLELNEGKIFSIFGSIFKHFNQTEESLKRSFVSFGSRVTELGRNLAEYSHIFLSNLNRSILQTRQKISSLERLMLTYSPERQLKLGYSIVRSGGFVIKNTDQIKVGQAVEVAMANGFFESEVKKINKK